VCILYFDYVYIFYVSSPYMVVVGDDRIICYTRPDNVSSGAGDA